MPSKIGPAVIALLCVVSLYFLLGLEIDNRQDRLLDSGGQEAIDHRQFQRDFGNDDKVVIAISGKDLFDEDGLDAMVEAMDRLEDNPLITNVTGIPALYRENFGEEDPEALEEELTSTPFYEGLFISPEHDAAGFLVETAVLNAASEFREASLHVLDSVQPMRDFGYRVDIVGGPVFDVAINELSVGESMRMFPIAAIASLIVLISLLRSIRATLVVLICGAVALLLTIASVPVTGRTLNIVTSALPLVLWVLSLANCIHIVNHYLRRLAQTASPEVSIQETMASLRFPCSLSAITTAFGFVSLAVADIGPIRELGIYMALGMLISLVVNLTLCPYLLIALKITAPPGSGARTSRVLGGLANTINRRPAPFVAIFALLLLGGIYGATQLRTETDSTRFLPKGGELRNSYDFVSQNLTGLHTLEIVVDTPNGWLDPVNWEPIEAMASDLEEMDIVARVYTPLDFIKKTNQWDHDFDLDYYKLPDTGEEAQELVDLMSGEDNEQLPHFVTGDGHRVRLSVLINTMDAQQFAVVVDRAREHIARLAPPLSGVATGTATRMLAMQVSLIRTQIESFSLAFLLVFLAILVGLRSLRLTLLSMIPNIMPLLSVFATMALLGVPLDAGTVMVASISLGIAVDDTVHFLAAYRKNRSQGQDPAVAIHTTLSRTGSSLVVTTITACIGFFTLSLSSFPPISYLGLLSGLAILVALAADLMLVPAIFVLRRDPT